MLARAVMHGGPQDDLVMKDLKRAYPDLEQLHHTSPLIVYRSTSHKLASQSRNAIGIVRTRPIAVELLVIRGATRAHRSMESMCTCQCGTTKYIPATTSYYYIAYI
jgi:hypothetical protein